MNFIFLDFDGVLFNTLKEAYVLCRYAYNGTDYFDAINKTEYESFYRYKFLVYNSWQYYYIMKLLSKGSLTDNDFISEYKEYLKNRDLTAERDFDEKYYSARIELMRDYNDFWNKLETPFKFFYEIEKTNYTPIIVSKKNKTAIEYRLKQHSSKILSENIYGKDELTGYRTKAEFINNYIIENNLSSAYFIDDNSNNLRPCKQYPKITPLLAGWGNIAIGEVGKTCDEILSIIQRY